MLNIILSSLALVVSLVAFLLARRRRADTGVWPSEIGKRVYAMRLLSAFGVIALTFAVDLLLDLVLTGTARSIATGIATVVGFVMVLLAVFLAPRLLLVPHDDSDYSTHE